MRANERQCQALRRSVEVMTSPTAPHCAVCGCTAPDDGSWRLTWVSGLERGQEVWTCDRCARTHLRSIEAKLDTAWW